MKIHRIIVLLATLLFAASVSAQLRPYTDYTPGEDLTMVTTVKVHANMIDDYLEGLRSTWVESNEVAKSLGQLKDYGVYVSQMPNGGDFNLVLVEVFDSAADLEPSKERYDAFMKAWGDANEDKTREIVKNYPAMREITGQYLMRRISFTQSED